MEKEISGELTKYRNIDLEDFLSNVDGYSDADCELLLQALERIPGECRLLKIEVKSPHHVRGMIATAKYFQAQNSTKDYDCCTCCRWPRNWELIVTMKREISCQIWSLPNVVALNLSNCRMETLPDEVSFLTHLVKLDVGGNSLYTFPFSLSLCRNLQKLYLENNCLNALPLFIRRMESLTELRRSHNHFNVHFNRVGTVCKRNKQEESKSTTSTPLSLRELSSFSVPPQIAKGFMMSHTYVVPKPVEDSLVDCFKRGVIDVCDCCLRAHLGEQGYLVKMVRSKFLGCTYIPLQGSACSVTCATRLLTENDELNALSDGDSAGTTTIVYDYWDGAMQRSSNARRVSLREWLCGLPRCLNPSVSN